MKLSNFGKMAPRLASVSRSGLCRAVDEETRFRVPPSPPDSSLPVKLAAAAPDHIGRLVP